MFITITRFLTGGIFLFSAIVKIFTPNPFLRMFYEIGFGLKVTLTIMLFIVLTELYLAFLLLLNKKSEFKFSFIYMSIITFALIVLWLSGVDADCGCFGGFIHSQIGPVKILQNMALIAMLGVCWKNTTDEKTDHTRSFVK